MKKVLLIFCLLLITLTLGAPHFAPLPTLDSTRWAKQYPDCTTEIRVWALQRTLERMVSLDCYKPHDGWTYCNISSKDALDNRPHPWGKRYGFMLDDLALDLTAIWPTVWSTWAYSIKTDYKAALRAVRMGRVDRVMCQEGFYLAQQGEIVFVVSAKYNHEAIVYPDMRPWNDDRGCRIAQCGRWNVITDISHRWTFGKWWTDPEIIFIHIKRRSI